MELRDIATYARAVRPSLADEVFVPARSRLLWLPFHVAVIAALAWSITTRELPALLWPIASIIIACSMSAVAFLGHETLHGGVVRGRVAIRLVGWICMLPFTVSPTLWTAWHNRVHHNQCAKPGIDPDSYPTVEEYERDPFMRVMADNFGLGGRRLSSLPALLFGFTGQSQQMLWEARKHGFLSRQQYVRAISEFLVGVSFWILVGFAIGFVPFVFVYLIPLVIANVIVMMFISTNHSLSSLTPDVNDALVNSLSVTLPRPLEWLSLCFGYHVEHHIFPAISMRHGPAVRAALRAKYPDHYQSMPLTSAVRRLWQTGRVYRNPTTLVDPQTGETSPTLQPRS